MVPNAVFETQTGSITLDAGLGRLTVQEQGGSRLLPLSAFSACSRQEDAVRIFRVPAYLCRGLALSAVLLLLWLFSQLIARMQGHAVPGDFLWNLLWTSASCAALGFPCALFLKGSWQAAVRELSVELTGPASGGTQEAAAESLVFFSGDAPLSPQEYQLFSREAQRLCRALTPLLGAGGASQSPPVSP